MSGALGLMFGTAFEPRTVPMLFGVILVPITFLGSTYYSWQALEAIRWLQVVSLLNPLVYLSEGFRAALTPVPHMSLLAVYPIVVGFTGVFTWLGIRGFARRVVV
jgi:ABC-2 type transport system permease protein